MPRRSKEETEALEAGMLEDFARLSGLDLFQEDALEDTEEYAPSLENDYGDDVDDYIDAQFDDLDVDQDEGDSSGAVV